MTKEFNISNLKKYVSENGSVIKNYKTLCDILEMPYASGKQKKLLVEKLSYYFSFERDGNKYIINEIFETPKPMLSYKKNKYLYNIEHCLYHMLKDKDSEIFTFNQLALRLGFYDNSPNDYTVETLSDYCYFITPVAKDFFMHVNCNKIIERALTKLAEANIINIRDVYLLYDKKGKASNTSNFSDEELKIIYSICESTNNDALSIYANKYGKDPKEMNMSKLYLPEDKRDFYKIKNKLIQERTPYDKIIRAVEISLNPDYVPEDVEDMPSMETLVQRTNTEYYKGVLRLKKLRISKRKKKYYEENGDEWGDISAFDVRANYYEEYRDLCDVVIKINDTMPLETASN